jgi:hypothetical protein
MIRTADGINKLANTCLVMGFVLLALEVGVIGYAVSIHGRPPSRDVGQAIWAIGLLLPTAICAAFLLDSHIRPRPFRVTIAWATLAVIVPIATVFFIIRVTHLTLGGE